MTSKRTHSGSCQTAIHNMFETLSPLQAKSVPWTEAADFSTHSADLSITESPVRDLPACHMFQVSLLDLAVRAMIRVRLIARGVRVTVHYIPTACRQQGAVTVTGVQSVSITHSVIRDCCLRFIIIRHL